jgi:hypothetical protein
MDEIKINLEDIEGSKGGGGGGSAYIPVEDPNTLRSKATARVIDLLCEGEIEGLVDGNESIYLNEVPLYTGATANFTGVTVWTRNGTPTQDYIPRFSKVESEIGVNVEMKYGAPTIRNINDADIDDVRVTVQVPTLLTQADNGDLRATSVEIKISIAPQSTGVYVENTTLTISGKCTSEYQRSYLVTDLTATYGAGPWFIKLERLTADSDSAKLQNATWWLTYTTVINEKLIYPDTALVGCEIDSEQFGDTVPNRAYRIQGLKIKYPANYTPSTHHYVGVWNGTFTTGYCNNPAWVYYDLLTNTRYGAGIDESYIDKYALYTIARYCDAVDNNGDFVGVDDGFGGKEVRFSFNGVIQTREEAYKVISYMASTFRSFPIFSNAYISAIQDIPTSATRVVTNSNVIDGLFTYEGSSLKTRNTVVNVAWNDLDDFGRVAIETYYDADSIVTYGYKPVDITAFGCTSRGQAKRIGKWLLDTQLNATETVRYTAGWDHIDAIPGEVIQVADNHYAATRFGGRTVSCTTTQLVIDNAITLSAGETYTLSFQTPAGTLKEVTVTNAKPYTGVTLTFAAIDAGDVAEAFAVWVISASNLETRQFRIVTNREVEPGKYEIVALLYDPNKYARVEEGIIFDEAPTSRLPDGVLEPPTTVVAELYDYVEGPNQVHKWGVLISWVHSTDPRKNYYQVQVKEPDSAYYDIGTTATNSLDWRPTNLYTETYNFRVRTSGIIGFSAWAYSGPQAFDTTPAVVEDVTGLQVKGGGDEFDGQDCEIEWDDATSTTFGEYRIVVYTVADLLLRQESSQFPYYNYTFEKNNEDNAGTPIRQIKFKVYVIDVYGQVSPNAAILVADNPAPDMSGTLPTVTAKIGYLQIDWANSADNDMYYYAIKGGTANPPTDVIGYVNYPVNTFNYFGLTYGTTYYVRIVPYDKFGIGTASQIPAGASPLIIPDINVDVELEDSITMTDSDSNTAVTLAKLYDRNYASDGVTYVLAGVDKYIQYAYNIENYFDRLAIWTNNASGRIYVGYSVDGSSWSWLSGEADHTLDANSNLVTAANQAAAITNYFQLAAGFNYAGWPNNITAKYVRLYFTGTYTTIVYEFIPSRLLISELAAIESLSAISADIGTIVAGTLQSSDYGAAAGMQIDLDAKTINLGGSGTPVFKFYNDGTYKVDINAAVTFRSGTTGYANIGDKPTLGDLAALDTVGAADCDNTIIDGGKIITGLLTASNIQTGTLDAGLVTISSDDGNTVMSGDTIIVTDNAAVVRVKIGKLT